MRPVALAALAAALLLTGCSAAARDTGAGTAHPVRGAGAGGDILVTGAYVGDDGAAGYRPVYMTFRDDGPDLDELQAVIAPVAQSTTWVVSHHVHTPAEIAAFAEPCGADPLLLAASAAALAASSDLQVPAGGQTWLTPGVARLQLNDVGPLHAGQLIPMTLYFASGAVVQLDVPVAPGRQVDPLRGT